MEKSQQDARRRAKRARDSSDVDAGDHILLTAEEYDALDNQKLASALRQNLNLVILAAKAAVMRLNKPVDNKDKYKAHILQLNRDLMALRADKTSDAAVYEELLGKCKKVENELKKATDGRMADQEAHNTAVEDMLAQLDGVISEKVKLK